jgi:hypothetical protein
MSMFNYSPRCLKISKGIKMGMTVLLAISGGVTLLLDNLDNPLVWLVFVALVAYGVAEFILLIDFSQRRFGSKE